MPEKPKVLIVDDEASIRKVLAMCCQRAGFDTTSASDGLEALDLAGCNSFDVIVTDYQMPRINGIDLCRQLRTYDRHANTRIIFCSAGVAELDTNALQRDLGGMTFLAKPLELHKLADLLRTIATTLPLDAV